MLWSGSKSYLTSHIAPSPSSSAVRDLPPPHVSCPACSPSAPNPRRQEGWGGNPGIPPHEEALLTSLAGPFVFKSVTGGVIFCYGSFFFFFAVVVSIALFKKGGVGLGVVILPGVWRSRAP